MISLILEDRCTGCNNCVTACPTHVLDASDAGAPTIARLDQCQTCYLCELYCPEDAIFVAPDQRGPEKIDAATALASGHVGRMRHDQGWNKPEDRQPLEVYWRLGPLLGQGSEIAGRRYAREHPAEPTGPVRQTGSRPA